MAIDTPPRVPRLQRPARVRWVQRILDPLLVRLEADHLLRDPLDWSAAVWASYIERGVARRHSVLR
jgi:hypothetical protein